MTLIETKRLFLRRFVMEDAHFVLDITNDRDWIKFIGDRGIRNLVDATAYITQGPFSSYEKHGFGLYVVERKDDRLPIGICGLLQRDNLEHPDIGFAFLPAHRRFGFAFEAAKATLDYGFGVLDLDQILAITALDNEASIDLLKKLEMTFVKIVPSLTHKDGNRLFSIARPL